MIRHSAATSDSVTAGQRRVCPETSCVCGCTQEILTELGAHKTTIAEELRRESEANKPKVEPSFSVTEKLT